MGKRVFVTVGTTQFDELIQSIISDPNRNIQKVLKKKGFSHLSIQSGKSPVNATGISKKKLSCI